MTATLPAPDVNATTPPRNVRAEPPRVSIIVATYNRATLLDECLDHLGRQRFRPGDEVIVVDNGSTDDTAAVVARHRSRYAVPLRLLNESLPGKSRAIARALIGATGEVLAFTDDDVNADDGWLDAVRTAMSDADVALMGGPVAPRWHPAVPQWIRRARERRPRLGAPLALLDYGDRWAHERSSGRTSRCAGSSSPSSGASRRISASCAAPCCPAKITSCAGGCRLPVSAPCTSRAPSSTTTCPPIARACRTF
jgi:cellulose synthase/poly-beta-1,6-N-acetylglucosamine synthase-like glycosyltransferase